MNIAASCSKHKIYRPCRLVQALLSYQGPRLTLGVHINYLTTHKTLWD